ncbi:MAG: hypothetical protein QXR58_01250 [Candidatus Micrarchaeaceae archaeon]
MLGALWELNGVEFAFLLLFIGLFISIFTYLICTGYIYKRKHNDE